MHKGWCPEMGHHLLVLLSGSGEPSVSTMRWCPLICANQLRGSAKAMALLQSAILFAKEVFNRVEKIMTRRQKWLVLLTVTFSLLSISIANAAIGIGDTVRVTANLNVRTGAGTSYPEITDPDYPGYAPVGTIGKVLQGPVSANGYIWWRVDFGPGLYTGWAVQDGLEEVSIPSAPTPTSPGSGSEPGPTISTLTPIFQWSGVSGADRYGLYISQYPYGSGYIVYENENISGSSTSFNLPSGVLYQL